MPLKLQTLAILTVLATLGCGPSVAIPSKEYKEAMAELDSLIDVETELRVRSLNLQQTASDNNDPTKEDIASFDSKSQDILFELRSNNDKRKRVAMRVDELRPSSPDPAVFVEADKEVADLETKQFWADQRSTDLERLPDIAARIAKCREHGEISKKLNAALERLEIARSKK